MQEQKVDVSISGDKLPFEVSIHIINLLLSSDKTLSLLYFYEMSLQTHCSWLRIKEVHLQVTSSQLIQLWSTPSTYSHVT